MREYAILEISTKPLADQEQWDVLVTALLDADLLELLMSNLNRLDEDNESDRSGVYHSLAVMESLAVSELTGKSVLRCLFCSASYCSPLSLLQT